MLFISINKNLGGHKMKKFMIIISIILVTIISTFLGYYAAQEYSKTIPQNAQINAQIENTESSNNSINNAEYNLCQGIEITTNLLKSENGKSNYIKITIVPTVEDKKYIKEYQDKIVVIKDRILNILNNTDKNKVLDPESFEEIKKEMITAIVESGIYINNIYITDFIVQ